MDNKSQHPKEGAAVPIGYLPAYELGRLKSGHDANLRSAKFGPSPLDGDVPVYLALAQQAAAKPAFYVRQMDMDAQFLNTSYIALKRAQEEWTVPLYAAPARADEAGDAKDAEREFIVYGGKRMGRKHLAALEKDAARYRWLRDQNNSLETRQYDKGIVNGPSCYHDVEGIRELKSGDALDAAIDRAAMAAPTEQMGGDHEPA